jgi:cell division protein FtsN
MAQRRSYGHRAGAKRLPGWVWLLLGLTLGMASVLLTQLVVKRAGSHDGLAGLFAAKVKQVETTPAKRPEPVPPKPKLDFYTVLPEIETVLPDRNLRGRTGKTERAEMGARYILQAGSFASFEEADQLKAKLALQGLQAQIQKVAIEGKGEYHRVRLGPYRSLEDLDAVSHRLSKLGIKALRLKLKGAAG